MRHLKMILLSTLATATALYPTLPAASAAPTHIAHAQIAKKGIDWGNVAGVFLSYAECEAKLTYYELTFKRVGVCIPGPHGTWLFSIGRK